MTGAQKTRLNDSNLKRDNYRLISESSCFI